MTHCARPPVRPPPRPAAPPGHQSDHGDRTGLEAGRGGGRQTVMINDRWSQASGGPLALGAGWRRGRSPAWNQVISVSIENTGNPVACAISAA
jgi:hypothetical protein